MLDALRDFYNAEMVNPGIAGVFINPFYFARKGLYEAVLSLSGAVTGRVLDVGCGAKPYERLFRTSEYIGLELDTPENRVRKRADVFYNGAVFPFETEKFDSLVCNQVLEHVFNPGLFVNELNRVLKPGGHLLLTVPFVWDEHEQPWDYARYSSFGLKALLCEHGFEVVEHRKTMTDIRALVQLGNGYLYKVTAAESGLASLVWTLLLMAPLNLIGILLGRITPSNPDLYLDNVVLARKVPAR